MESKREIVVFSGDERLLASEVERVVLSITALLSLCLRIWLLFLHFVEKGAQAVLLLRWRAHLAHAAHGLLHRLQAVPSLELLAAIHHHWVHHATRHPHDTRHPSRLLALPLHHHLLEHAHHAVHLLLHLLHLQWILLHASLKTHLLHSLLHHRHLLLHHHHLLAVLRLLGDLHSHSHAAKLDLRLHAWVLLSR